MGYVKFCLFDWIIAVNSSLWELNVSVFFHGIPNGWLNVNISELGIFHHQPVSFKSASEPVRVVLNISEVRILHLAPPVHNTLVLHTVINFINENFHYCHRNMMECYVNLFFL
jgi:hypothetical protein